jgi:hypothetical protein
MGGFSAAQAIIGAMITPALPILASGSLIASALVRLARVADHVRTLADAGGMARQAELRRHERRALLAERRCGAGSADHGSGRMWSRAGLAANDPSRSLGHRANDPETGRLSRHGADGFAPFAVVPAPGRRSR